MSKSYFTITRPAWNVFGETLPDSVLCMVPDEALGRHALEFRQPHAASNVCQFTTPHAATEFIQRHRDEFWNDNRTRLFFYYQDELGEDYSILYPDYESKHRLAYFATIHWNKGE
jgi:hypothetical protein